MIEFVISLFGLVFSLKGFVLAVFAYFAGALTWPLAQKKLQAYFGP